MAPDPEHTAQPVNAVNACERCKWWDGPLNPFAMHPGKCRCVECGVATSYGPHDFGCRFWEQREEKP